MNLPLALSDTSFVHTEVSPTGRAKKTEGIQMDLIAQWNLFASWMRAKFGQDERGASLVEYALLVALIAVVCIGAVTILGGNASDKFSEVGSKVQ